MDSDQSDAATVFQFFERFRNQRGRICVASAHRFARQVDPDGWARVQADRDAAWNRGEVPTREMAWAWIVGVAERTT